MYNSQYYTCEQIDQRLLQGYVDDYNIQTGQSLTKEQFLTKLGSIFSKEGVIDNTATQIGYYECDTAAGTAAKAITVHNYSLFAGGSMKVKFVNKNTANNATLNINSKGAKALYYQGERASSTNSWDEGEVVEIYYDGTSYYANNVNGGSGSGVYDVSKEHPTSGPNSDGKFTLEYILDSSNVNELIPVNKRYPGMYIQFISTSDNKYVQYRLMSNAFSTDESDWQGVDERPTPSSDNLVKSNGIYTALGDIDKALSDEITGYTLYNYGILGGGTFSTDAAYKHAAIAVTPGEKYILKRISGYVRYVFATSNSYSKGGAIPKVEGTSVVLLENNGDEALIEIPDGCNYLLFNAGNATYTAYSAQLWKYRSKIENALTTKDVVNDLERGGVDKPLSAEQGKTVATYCFNKIPFNSYSGAVKATDGKVYSVDSRKYTSYVELGNISKLIYARAITSGSGASYGLAFYDAEKVFISGVREFTSQPYVGYILQETTVPEGAVYARFTFWADNSYGLFFFADGERDASAIALLKSYNDNLYLLKDGYFGFETGKKHVASSGAVAKDDNFGYSIPILVNKGDTVVWSYPGAEIRSCSMGVYSDVECTDLVTYFNNTEANKRTIEMTSSSLPDSFYISASFLLAEAEGSYVSVNGVKVWSAKPASQSYVDTTAAKCASDAIDAYDLKNTANYTIPSEYSVNGKCISSEQWTSAGSCYMIPVSAGDVFYIKARASNYSADYAYLANNVMEGEAPYVGIDALQRYTSTTKWLKLEIPEGCNYLYFNHTYSSGYNHTPIIKHNVNGEDIDKGRLQVGTFNSSFNEENVKAVREKYSSLIRGKDNIETFLYFTDPHLSDYNRYEGNAINSNYYHMTEELRDKYISMLQKYYNSLPLDICICGGDWLNYCSSYMSACDELGYCDGYMRKLFKNYHPVMGNHDNNPYEWSSAGKFQLTTKEVRNLAFRENGNVYYSFDGLNTKFYVMNTGASSTNGMTDYKWTQVDWFATNLLTDNPDHAVILTHLFGNGMKGTPSGSYSNWRAGVHKFPENLVSIASAFNDRRTITLNGHTYDFSDCTGRVEAYIVGHNHADIIDTVYDIPIIVTTNLEGGFYGDRINYENHNYALIPTFDACLADYDNHTINMIRVGAGVNRMVHTIPFEVTVGNTIELTPNLSGEITWYRESDSSSGEDPEVLSVVNGVVTGIIDGNGGVRAVNGDGEEEYWIIKVYNA